MENVGRRQQELEVHYDIPFAAEVSEHGIEIVPALSVHGLVLPFGQSVISEEGDIRNRMFGFRIAVIEDYLFSHL